MKRLRYAFAALCIGTGAVIACGPGFLDGISGGTRADSGVHDGSTSGSSGEAATCSHAEVPDRPPGTDDSSDAITIPTFAFDGIRLDTLPDPDAGSDVEAGISPKGLDLDNTCTCEAQKDSCIRPGDAGPACDGPDGRDNTFGTLFNNLVTGIQLFPVTFATQRIHGGRFTVLLDILGWNGKPDDPGVQVAVRQSQKIDSSDGGRGLPEFDGNDVWTVDPATISGGQSALGKDCQDPANAFACIGLTRDLNAYVAGGVLVAHPRLGTAEDPVTITIRTAAGLLTLPYRDFTVFATISGPDNGQYHLQGEMAGRISVTDLNQMFGNLQDFTSSDPTAAICQNTPLFLESKASVCSYRDLAYDGGSGSCDAISAAAAFSAGPAIVGTVFQGDPTPSPCGGVSFDCDN